MLWQTKALVVLAASLTAMGLRLAVTPWLDDELPFAFAFPAVAGVALVCGLRWAVALAVLVLVWVSLPWLPPNWPVASAPHWTVAVVALLSTAAIGLLARAREAAPARPVQPGRVERALRLAMVLAIALPGELLGGLAWIATFLIKHSGFKRGLKRDEAHTGAVTLIQRFGSAANLNIHLHCPRWERKGPTPSSARRGVSVHRARAGLPGERLHPAPRRWSACSTRLSCASCGC